MPIRGLTERVRMPRIDKIHLGVKALSAGGKEYPKQTDHFVCPPNVVEALRDKVPFCECAEPGPLELPIMFVTDSLDDAVPQHLLAYKQTVGRVCKGDGYHADALLDADALAQRKGDITAPLPIEVWASSRSKATVRTSITCLGEGYEGADACPMYAAKACKKLMMMQFAIMDAPGLGVYQLDTSSVYGIQNINGFLAYLTSATGGRISGIPVTLRLASQEVAPEGKKKTVYVVQLEAKWTMEELYQYTQRPGISALLTPPDEDVPEDFFPGESEQVPSGEPVTGPIVNAQPDLDARFREGDVTPDGYNWPSFAAEWTEKGIDPKAVKALIGGNASSMKAVAEWVQAEPGRTLDGLLRDALARRPAAEPADEAPPSDEHAAQPTLAE